MRSSSQETCQPVRVREVSGRRARHQFVRFPWKLYRDSPNWIPPLHRDVRFKLDAKRNPFYRYGQVKTFLAYSEGGEVLGRIAAILNPLHQKMHGDATGFFGLFECVHREHVAGALLAAVRRELSAKGCTHLVGPVNLSTNDETGLLLEGHDQPPTYMCNYCPAYYHDLMRACALEKVIDTFAYEASHGHPFPIKYERIHRRAARHPSIRVRRFARNTAHSDCQDIRLVYNEAFQQTWGYLPISEAEAAHLARSLLTFADLDLVWIATYDDEPAGAILGFPDANELLRDLDGRLFPLGWLKFVRGQRHIQGMRIAALGVRPRFRSLGIESLLIHQVHERVHTRPYARSEFSVVMENNAPMRNLLEAFGFRLCKRFRLYQGAV